jgi:hypothetical protein
LARSSKVDSCLICDCVPCECNAASKKVAKKAAPKATKKVKTSAIEAMKARVANPEPISVFTPQVAEPGPAVITEEEEFRSALLALAPILHPDELVKYRTVVGHPDRRLLSTRASEWRERNALQDST